MSGETLGLIELLLVFGGVFAFGFWQLWSLRRERQRDPAPNAKAEPTAPSNPPASAPAQEPADSADASHPR